MRWRTLRDPDAEPGESDMLVLRSADGTERVLLRSPAAGRIERLTAGPDGDVIYEHHGSVFRHDVATGETTGLGSSTALARDW